MNMSVTVEACVDLISKGLSFAQAERTLKGYGYTEEQRQEIMQAVKEDISRRKKGNGKAD